MNLKVVSPLIIAALVCLLPNNLQARWMNPALGRFYTMDAYEGSKTDPLSLHKYLYCHGDPVNRVDPSGHYGDIIEFSIASSLSMSIRGTWEGARAPTYQGAITAALVVGLLITAADVIPTAIDKIEQQRRQNRTPYFRYDVNPGKTLFEPGTEITDRGDLEWDRAVSISYMQDLTAGGITTIYMYTIMARPGDIGPHPSGPRVFGDVRQFVLENTVAVPNVILTRVINKPDQGYKGPF